MIFLVTKIDKMPNKDAINTTIPIKNGDNPFLFANNKGRRNKFAINATLIIKPIAITRKNVIFLNNSISTNGCFAFVIQTLNKIKSTIERINSILFIFTPNKVEAINANNNPAPIKSK
ncbi:Uncharacterised protein [Streptococcus pneumoniae]|nr:Uncharacterised protein [Streptococcus pneumoniae]COP86099.1 Uncharacterised protein [Streptococcus pneumoniae]COQ43944.1 Uncharacterised protein [Streptococcus pneumoniae]COS64702.1 Uncharacterised protein [Streptococcus pneumoniae]